MIIGKMNQITIIHAYQTYLEAQIEKDPVQKEKLMSQTYHECEARD